MSTQSRRRVKKRMRRVCKARYIVNKQSGRRVRIPRPRPPGQAAGQSGPRARVVHSFPPQLSVPMCSQRASSPVHTLAASAPPPTLALHPFSPQLSLAACSQCTSAPVHPCSFAASSSLALYSFSLQLQLNYSNFEVFKRDDCQWFQGRNGFR